MATKKGAAIGYARVSTDDQDLSIESQTAKIEAYALARELDLSQVITDCCSGKDLGRPGIQEIRNLVNAGLADAIVIIRLDRLTRSLRDLLDLIDWLDTARRKDGAGRGVALLAVEESLDTQSDTGRAMLRITGVFAQWERERISSRTRAALQELKRQNRPAGHVEFGKLLNPDTGLLEDNPRELAVLSHIRTLHGQDLSLQQISDRLTAAGHRNRQGGAFSKVRVGQLIKQFNLKGGGTP